jgi:hypothetical protein
MKQKTTQYSKNAMRTEKIDFINEIRLKLSLTQHRSVQTSQREQYHQTTQTEETV